MPVERIYGKEEQSYMRQLLNDSAQQENCRKVYRMKQHVFLNFCNLLKSKGLLHDTRSISVEEQVAMFLLIVGQNQRYGVTQDRLRRCAWTVSTYFNQVLNAVISLGDDLWVKLESSTPSRIQNDPLMFPYFKDCVGAIDGTYVKATIWGQETARFRNRKGDLSQNVLAACNFDMEFTYVLSGWEGSAADARVLRDALSRTHNLRIPSGKYYLADAGYPNRPQFLVPYKGVRYHLQDYDRSSTRNAKEMFNHRHSKLRNVIERTFGVVKNRFAILKGKKDRDDVANEFSDGESSDSDEDSSDFDADEEGLFQGNTQMSLEDIKRMADNMRDTIANSMWRET
ncbi:hypothetical protein QJS10_CPB21g01045 [Acorus calamus]|uniref:DDE Tnp4 domain-containing protein n=1 Tax=Acorus calamus TaxID=4465 RepID=A0AAV9C5F7_ACOCL|nr:hypothetical protein QJS10_CPB21g01045 [Acorus calamus]